MVFSEIISVLLIEDNPGDADLINEMLGESEFGNFKFNSVETLNEGFNHLKSNDVDVLLLDLNLPDSTEMDTLIKAREKFPEIPIVVLTGSYSESNGLKALNKAQDYLTKGRINEYILSKSIFYSIERYKNEKKLKDLILKLERSNDGLQQFAYITSHDLQEPLRTITSFTQLLERRYKGKLDPDADEYIEFIVSGASRMKEMIEGLLEYSRIGTKDVNKEQIEIEEVLKDVLVNLHATIEDNGAVISHNQLPKIMADKNQIYRLFQNLIGNAIKFKKPDEAPKIYISARRDEKSNEYIFSVHDNGIGIESEYNDKIFEVFKRLHTIDEYSGTGIGLAISRRIVERHGGNLWVESKLGEGSTFYFSMPINGC